MIIVLGGEVDLYTTDEHTIAMPKGYGLVWDDDGKSLGKCSLFLGPIHTTNEEVENISPLARKWFGDEYVARKATIDVPDGPWDPVGRVREIVYFRPGEYADDWRHEFKPPVKLLKQGRWYRLKLPKDCSVTYRGIERP